MTSQNPNQNPEGVPDLSKIVHPSWTNSAGDSYTVTGLDVAGANVRRAVKEIMKTLDPAIIDEYKKIKNQGRESGKPASLAAHREATKFLFAAFVDATMQIPGF